MDRQTDMTRQIVVFRNSANTLRTYVMNGSFLCSRMNCPLECCVMLFVVINMQNAKRRIQTDFSG